MKERALLERIFPSKKNEVKRAILYDALKCFTQFGADSTTIEMIKQQSNMSIGSIYHHFKNKEGILAALFFAAIDDLNHVREQQLIQSHNSKESVIAVIFSYIDWIDDHPHFAEIMLTRELDIMHSEHAESFKKRKSMYRKRLINWFSIPQNIQDVQHIPKELIPSLVLGVTEHYAKSWLLGQTKSPPEHLKEELALMTWGLLESYQL
ncbi:TetR/AcrR family transcriptional regulator [Acinetobacter defluvii]|uniref:TetR/AcrR family transcriptional regulator n=1 Tax=Acinetobacter defluvii TaxID=1871111 RepID=UPI003AF846D0